MFKILCINGIFSKPENLYVTLIFLALSSINAGKLLVEFLLTKEGSDLFVEGEAIYSFRKGYKAPAAAAPYLMDLSKHKLIGLDDWVGAAKSFKSVRAEWAKNYR